MTFCYFFELLPERVDRLAKQSFLATISPLPPPLSRTVASSKDIELVYLLHKIRDFVNIQGWLATFGHIQNVRLYDLTVLVYLEWKVLGTFCCIHYSDYGLVFDGLVELFDIGFANTIYWT